jgi:hypothetical protein
MRTPRAVAIASSRVQHLTRDEREAVAQTADEYRSLVLLVIGQAMVGVASRIVARYGRAQTEAAMLAVVSMASLLVLIVMAGLAARKAYRAADGMRFGSPVGWSVAVLLGGVFAVAAMNGRAKEWAARYNIGFGVLGPKLDDIDQLVASEGARGRPTRS